MLKETPHPRPLSGAERGKGPGAPIFQRPFRPVTNSKNSFEPIVQRLTLQEIKFMDLLMVLIDLFVNRVLWIKNLSTLVTKKSIPLHFKRLWHQMD